ncbi:MAG: hypothetical protein JSR34_07035 [Proteobacteria bacterium]|nr:hypothetical protein [Pseudomonadota bacterium]
MASTWQFERLSELVATLEALLGSRLGVTEASRKISAVRFDLKQDNNPLFYPFVGIDSETDQFPLGPVRDLWAIEALERYDQERILAERHYTPFAMQSATALLSWAQSAEF